MDELTKLLVQNPDLTWSLALHSAHRISPKYRMAVGMSAVSQPPTVETPQWWDLHRILEEARAYNMGWGRPAYDEWLEADPDDGIRELFRFNPCSHRLHDTGENYVVIFSFDPKLAKHFDRNRDDEYDDVTEADAVHDFVADRFGFGHPCGCGVCNAGGDCCGHRFCASLWLWPAEDGKWYGEAGFSINI